MVNVGAYNTIRQMLVPPTLLGSDMPARLHSTRLAWPGGTTLLVCRVWQGTVLGIVVDLSVLPYLLRLIPGPY